MKKESFNKERRYGLSLDFRFLKTSRSRAERRKARHILQGGSQPDPVNYQVTGAIGVSFPRTSPQF